MPVYCVAFLLFGFFVQVTVSCVSFWFWWGFWVSKFQFRKECKFSTTTSETASRIQSWNMSTQRFAWTRNAKSSLMVAQKFTSFRMLRWVFQRSGNYYAFKISILKVQSKSLQRFDDHFWKIFGIMQRKKWNGANWTCLCWNGRRVHRSCQQDKVLCKSKSLHFDKIFDQIAAIVHAWEFFLFCQSWDGSWHRKILFRRRFHCQETKIKFIRQKKHRNRIRSRSSLCRAWRWTLTSLFWSPWTSTAFFQKLLKAWIASRLCSRRPSFW